MRAEKYFHKCGYPILQVKQAVGPVEQTCFVDPNNPFNVDKSGNKTLRAIKQCPECKGTIVAERLLTRQPENTQPKGPTGYIPVKM